MTGRRTIAQQWDAYEQAVMPRGAGPIQRQEMRRAFYGGFGAALHAGLEIAGADLSEEAGAAVLHGYHEEVALFVQAVQEGRA